MTCERSREHCNLEVKPSDRARKYDPPNLNDIMVRPSDPQPKLDALVTEPEPKWNIYIHTNTTYATRITSVLRHRSTYTKRVALAKLYDGVLGGYWVREVFIPREHVVSIVVEEG